MVRPTFSLGVQTNIGKKFLKLIDINFPIGHKYRKLFNRGNIKTSYSAMPNMKAIINGSDKRAQENTPEKPCNCRVPENCPLQGNCNAKAVVYEAEVNPTTANSGIGSKKYIGMTGPFKARYNNHLSTFRHIHNRYATKLSSHIWTLKEKQTEYTIKWRIIERARPHRRGTRKCGICNTEKHLILMSTVTPGTYLNTRSEIFSKCRHVDRHLFAFWHPSETIT